MTAVPAGPGSAKRGVGPEPAGVVHRDGVVHELTAPRAHDRTHATPDAVGGEGAGAAKRPRCPCVRSGGLVVGGQREARGTRVGQWGTICPWDARSTIASKPDLSPSDRQVRRGIPTRYIADRQIAVYVCETVRPSSRVRRRSLFGDAGVVSKAAPSGVVARVTLATIVLAPEPLTRYAVAPHGRDAVRCRERDPAHRLQHAYDLVPKLMDAELIRVVGTVPTRPGKEPTRPLAATQAGVADWREWLGGPITMPDAMTRALSRLYAVRRGDYATMLAIIDRYEATLQAVVQQADGPRRTCRRRRSRRPAVEQTRARRAAAVVPARARHHLRGDVGEGAAMTLLALSGVSLRYPTATALADVSLEVVAGELVVVWGPARSGRTTLLEVAAGLRKPDSGTVAFDGRSPRASLGRHEGFAVVPSAEASVARRREARNRPGRVPRDARDVALACAVGSRRGLAPLRRRGSRADADDRTVACRANPCAARPGARARAAAGA